MELSIILNGNGIILLSIYLIFAIVTLYIIRNIFANIILSFISFINIKMIEKELNNMEKIDSNTLRWIAIKNKKISIVKYHSTDNIYFYKNGELIFPELYKHSIMDKRYQEFLQKVNEKLNY